MSKLTTQNAYDYIQEYLRDHPEVFDLEKGNPPPSVVARHFAQGPRRASEVLALQRAWERIVKEDANKAAEAALDEILGEVKDDRPRPPEWGLF